LKETYATCTQTCARLDLILDKINLLPWSTFFRQLFCFNVRHYIRIGQI
jgi:hypothetical protein